MDLLLQNLRYAVRMLIRSPGITIAAWVTLALAIGANTAIFSVVNAVLLRPLPYKDPDGLVMLWQSQDKEGRGPVSAPNYFDWRERNRVFEHVGAFAYQPFNITDGDLPERVSGSFASAELFAALGINAQIGRTFLPEEDQPGRAQVVLLSYGLWQRRFGGDQEIVGKPVNLNGKSLTIIGVMPPGFNTIREGNPGVIVIDDSEVWVPVAFIEELAPGLLARRNTNFLRVIGSLKQGVSIEQARSEMAAVAGGLEQQYPATNTGAGIDVVNLHSQLVGRSRPVLLILIGAVAFVLLIACTNVASLLLSRATARQKEIAIRMAMGADRRRLIQQLLTEGVLISLLGGATGILLSMWAINLLIALVPSNIPRIKDSNVDASVLLFTLFLSMLTGVIFGLVPALHATKPNMNELLNQEVRGMSPGSGAQRLRSLLMISETAIALILLIGAGLLVKSFARLQSVDPGYDPTNLLTLELILPPSKYPGKSQLLTFNRELLDRLGKVPGVQYAAVTNNLPLKGTTSVPFNIAGREASMGGVANAANYRIISPDYFRAMNILLNNGRYFTWQDSIDTSPVAIINETAARRFWAGEDPIGQRININNEKSGGDAPVWREIVGVIGDVRHMGLESEPNVEVYIPYAQNPGIGMNLVIRTSGDPNASIGHVRHELLALDKDQPVSNVTTMEKLLAGSTSQRRFNMLLMGLFAAVALTLAVIGIYAVTAYSVSLRSHEIGIRMALGATQEDVLKLIILRSTKLVLIGVAIGLGGAVALTRIMSSLLFEVSATDTTIFLAVPLALFGVGLIAAYVPARRATKVDPMIVMRNG